MKLVRWDDRIAILQKNSIAIFAFRFDVDDFLIVNILVFQIFDEAQPRNCDYWAEERNSGTWDHNRLDLKLSSVSSIRSICKINASTLETICKLQELFSPKMTELHLLVHKKSNVEYTSWHNSFSKLSETWTIAKLMLSWESTCKIAIPSVSHQKLLTRSVNIVFTPINLQIIYSLCSTCHVWVTCYLQSCKFPVMFQGCSQVVINL